MMWAHELATLRAQKPWIGDEHIRDCVAGAIDFIKKECGIELSEAAPQALQAAGFLFVLYVHERDAEAKRIIAANMALLTAPYRNGGEP